MSFTLLAGIERFGRFVHFSLATLRATPKAIVRRRGEVLEQFERAALGGLSLTAAAGLSVGLVTWLQLRSLLLAYGLEANLPSVLSAAVLVETGPILASLLVAGRLGAGLAAELGTMTLTEELDARAALGSPVIPNLVAPRVLACALAVPFLTVIIDASALVGGYLAELSAGSMSFAVYFQRALDFLRLSDVVPATLKTAVFGAVVGLVGCYTGVTADRSAESVGKAATRGVVRAMLAVFLVNVLIVPWIQAATTRFQWTS